MMRIVCVVQDVKSELYAAPMLFVNEADAVRNFADAVNREDANSMLYLHPEDYHLFRIGTYDDADGVLCPENHRRLMTGGECRGVSKGQLRGVN